MEEKIGFFILQFVNIKTLDSFFGYFVTGFVILVPIGLFVFCNLWLKRAQEISAEHESDGDNGKLFRGIFKLWAGFPFIKK